MPISPLLHAVAALEVTSPATGVRAGAVPINDAATVKEAAAAIRTNQPDWAALTQHQRVEWLHQFRDWLLDHADELAELIHLESGKVRHEALAEISVVADLINYTGRIAAKALREHHPAPHGTLGRTKRLTVTYRPYALVGIISPWNFPLAMAFMDAVPALAAGAAVLVKPSDVAPLSLCRAVEGWIELGAPAVLGYVTGGADTGRALVDAVDYIQFTGSTVVGREVAMRAADRMIPYSLELGGNDPMIVLADADLERAARGAAWGALFNTGQACVAVERIYVESSVHDEFVAKLVAHIEELRQAPDGEVGSMTNQTQLDLVTTHVADAIAGGARVLIGGQPTGRGLEFAPTVLIDVDHSMRCMREESFGPILPVMRVADEAEAVCLANDSDYGLSASVWTRDTGRGYAVARSLDVGAVNVNDVMANLMSYSIPQGGWKRSGLGTPRFGGAASLRKYTRTQAVTAPRIALRTEPNWFPYTGRRSAFLHRAVRLVVGRGRRRFR